MTGNIVASTKMSTLFTYVEELLERVKREKSVTAKEFTAFMCYQQRLNAVGMPLGQQPSISWITVPERFLKYVEYCEKRYMFWGSYKLIESLGGYPTIESFDILQCKD